MISLLDMIIHGIFDSGFHLGMQYNSDLKLFWNLNNPEWTSNTPFRYTRISFQLVTTRHDLFSLIGLYALSWSLLWNGRSEN